MRFVPDHVKAGAHVGLCEIHLAAHERGKQQRDAYHGSLGDLPRPDVVHPEAHEQGDRYRARDGEKAPWAVAQRVDNHEREHGEQDDHDRKIAIIAARPATGLTSSFAICPRDFPSRRTEAHRIKKSCTAPPSTTPAMSHKVPGRNPNCAARGWTDQWASAGDGRKVVAEEHPLRRDDEVATVVQPLSWRRSARVEAKDPVGDEARVEPISHQVGANRRDQQPRGTDRLASRERDEAQGASPLATATASQTMADTREGTVVFGRRAGVSAIETVSKATRFARIPNRTGPHYP